MSYGPVLHSIAQATHAAPAATPVVTNPATANAAVETGKNLTGKIRQAAKSIGGWGEAGLLTAAGVGWAGLNAAQDAGSVGDYYESRTGRSGLIPGAESALGSFIKRLLGIGVGGGIGFALGQVAAGGLNLKGRWGALARIPLALAGAVLGHEFIKHHSPTRGMMLREQMDYYYPRYGNDRYGANPNGLGNPYGTYDDVFGLNQDSYQASRTDTGYGARQRGMGVIDPYGGPRPEFIDSNHDGFNDIKSESYRDTRAPMALRNMAELRGDYKGYWHYPQNAAGESQGLPQYTMPHPQLNQPQMSGYNGYSTGNGTADGAYGDAWGSRDLLRLKSGGELVDMYRRSPRLLNNYFSAFQRHYTDNMIHGTSSYQDVMGMNPSAGYDTPLIPPQYIPS